MSIDYRMNKQILKSLVKAPDISPEERQYFDNAINFNDLIRMTQHLSVSTSPYVRLIEFLHFFRVNLNDYWLMYKFMYDPNVAKEDYDYDAGIAEMRKRFTYDIIRYDSNHKALDKFYLSFVEHMDVRERLVYSTDKEIDDYFHELEAQIIDSNSSLIFDYECYKEFFAEILSHMHGILHLDNEVEHFHITYLHLLNIGIKFLYPEVVTDIFKDCMDLKRSKEFVVDSDIKDFLLEWIEKICNSDFPELLKESQHISAVSFIDVFITIRDNWDAIANLAHNERLKMFLAKMLDVDKQKKELELQHIMNQLCNENQLVIMKRCISNAYLLNCVFVSNSRVKTKVIHAFFEKKCETELDVVLFCYTHFEALVCLNQTMLEELFYYACTFD